MADSERDFEAEAARDGWTPMEAWEGDPDKWVDAEEFVKRGENILPIVNAKNRKLNEKVDELSERLEQITTTSAEHQQFFSKALERERAEKSQALAQLREAQAKAIEESDGAAFKKASDQIDRMEREAETQPDQDKALQAEAAKWFSDNPIFQSDSAVETMLDGASNRVLREKPHLRGKAHLDEAAKLVKEALPEKFENPNRRKGNGVERPGGGEPPSGGRTYNDLPAEAQAACDRFVNDIPGFTKEQYLASYDWES